MLNSLIYVCDKSYQLSEQEYSNLVDHAAKKNKTKNITGLLCQLDDNYLQCLEGKPLIKNIVDKWMKINKISQAED